MQRGLEKLGGASTSAQLSGEMRVAASDEHPGVLMEADAQDRPQASAGSAAARPGADAAVEARAASQEDSGDKQDQSGGGDEKMLHGEILSGSSGRGARQRM